MKASISSMRKERSGDAQSSKNGRAKSVNNKKSTSTHNQKRPVGRPPKHKHKLAECKKGLHKPLSLIIPNDDTSEESHIVKSPLTSPRLRRLGVRQAEDQHSTTTESSFSENAGTVDLMRQFGFSDSPVPPTNRQLQRLLGSQISRYNSHSKLKSAQEVNNTEDQESGTDAEGSSKMLQCTECQKIFLCHHGYETHIECHPNLARKCLECNLGFVSNKSLVMHRRLRHNAKRENRDGKTSKGDTVTKGFHLITFTDFSSRKFPQICQYYCENNRSHTAGSFHDFKCTDCGKSFPMEYSLKHHRERHHNPPSKYICKFCCQDYKTKVALDVHRRAFQHLTKGRLTDAKRNYLHTIALFPACAKESVKEEQSDSRVNEMYYRKLLDTEISVKDEYEIAPSPENTENESADDE